MRAAFPPARQVRRNLFVQSHPGAENQPSDRNDGGHPDAESPIPPTCCCHSRIRSKMIQVLPSAEADLAPDPARCLDSCYARSGQTPQGSWFVERQVRGPPHPADSSQQREPHSFVRCLSHRVQSHRFAFGISDADGRQTARSCRGTDQPTQDLPSRNARRCRCCKN